jgi:AAA domain
LTVDAVKTAQREKILSIDESRRLALEHAFERVSVLRPLRFAAEVLKRGIGVINRANAETFLKSDPRIVRAGDLVSTRAVVQEETAMLCAAIGGKGKHAPLGSGKEWLFLDPQVSGDIGQRNGVDHLLESRDLALSIRGKAGSDKSTMAREAVAAIEALSGKRVFLFAPSSGAVEVLRKDGLPGETFQLLNANGKMQKGVSGHVLWIDEASFLSAKDMRWVLELARDNGCRLVLAGDTNNTTEYAEAMRLRVLEQSGSISQAILEGNGPY